MKDSADNNNNNNNLEGNSNSNTTQSQVPAITPAPSQTGKSISSSSATVLVSPGMNTAMSPQQTPLSPPLMASSPNSYCSNRSINNPFPPSLDQNSLPSSIESNQSHQSYHNQYSYQQQNQNQRRSSLGVAQGVDLLERQQLDWERKRAVAQYKAKAKYARRGAGGPQDSGNAGGVPMTVHLSGDGDDVSESLKDETGTVLAGGNGGGGTTQSSNAKEMKRVNSFGKFLKTPLKTSAIIKRSISDRFTSDPTSQTNSSSPTNKSTSTITMKPILYGYLHKLGRNGKWQKRYFESDGTSLLYYKDKNKTTILATLDLLHVGEIQLDLTDPAGCTFKIEVKGRDYYLCADTKERARDWVISLNRVKEARMQIGGLKLIEPCFDSGIESIIRPDADATGMDNQLNEEDEACDGQVAPRIVMSAQRKRLKGLGKDDFSEMERSHEEQNNSDKISKSPLSASAGTGSQTLNPNSPKPLRASHGHSSNLMAAGQAVQRSVSIRWTKRRNSMQNWVRRMNRWAKRLTMIRCIVKDDVVHFNSELHRSNQDHDGSQSNDNDETEPRATTQHCRGQDSFVDVGVSSYASYPELYSEKQLAGRQINFAEDVSKLSSKESVDTSAYHSNKSLPSRGASWKASQTSRKPEPIVKEEVSASSINSSSGRATPNEEDDEDEGSGVIA